MLTVNETWKVEIKRKRKRKTKDGEQNMVNESSWFNPLQFPYITEQNRQLGQIHHSEMLPLKYSPFADKEKPLWCYCNQRWGS